MRWYQYIWVGVVAVAGVVLWTIFRRKPEVSLRTEMGAIHASNMADKIEAERGLEQAIEAIKLQYAAEMQSLDERQREEADRLRDDPPALARYIVRAAGGKNSKGRSDNGRGKGSL